MRQLRATDVNLSEDAVLLAQGAHILITLVREATILLEDVLSAAIKTAPPTIERAALAIQTTAVLHTLRQKGQHTLLPTVPPILRQVVQLILLPAILILLHHAVLVAVSVVAVEADSEAVAVEVASVEAVAVADADNPQML